MMVSYLLCSINVSLYSNSLHDNHIRFLFKCIGCHIVYSGNNKPFQLRNEKKIVSYTFTVNVLGPDGSKLTMLLVNISLKL